MAEEHRTYGLTSSDIRNDKTGQCITILGWHYAAQRGDWAQADQLWADFQNALQNPPKPDPLEPDKLHYCTLCEEYHDHLNACRKTPDA